MAFIWFVWDLIFVLCCTWIDLCCILPWCVPRPQLYVFLPVVCICTFVLVALFLYLTGIFTLLYSSLFSVSTNNNFISVVPRYIIPVVHYLSCSWVHCGKQGVISPDHQMCFWCWCTCYTIDKPDVDGVSATHEASPRKYICAAEINTMISQLPLGMSQSGSLLIF